MKIEWGKKVCCPACSLAFYDLCQTSLTCPYCNYSFDANDMFAKKVVTANVEEVPTIEEEKAIGLPDFEFGNEDDHTDIQENDIDDDMDDLKIGDLG